MTKIYSLTIRNRAVAILFAVAVLGLGAVFLTVGLALLAGLAIAGGVLGAGYALVHRLRGGTARMGTDFGTHPGLDSALDPALEVHATRPAVVAPPADDADSATKRLL